MMQIKFFEVAQGIGRSQRNASTGGRRPSKFLPPFQDLTRNSPITDERTFIRKATIPVFERLSRRRKAAPVFETRWSRLTPARARSPEELVGLGVPQEDLEALPFAQLGRPGVELVLLLALVRHRHSAWMRDPLPSARKGMQEDGRSRGLLRTCARERFDRDAAASPATVFERLQRGGDI